MRFAKGHGTENDFVILPDPEGRIELTAGLAARLCDRRAGLGADGVLRAVLVPGAGLADGVESPDGGRVVGAGGADRGSPDMGRVGAEGVGGVKSPDGGRVVGAGGADRGSPDGTRGTVGAGGADFKAPDGSRAEWFMDYRNADGSVAEMCGNGIRVFARYLLDRGFVAGPEFAVATRAGTRLVRAEEDGSITVDMGPPRVLGAGRGVLAGRPFDGLAVSLGNPHLACLVSEPLDGFDLSQPPQLDARQFPAGANFELLRLAGDAHIEMRVHERGSGATRSCGTGAVAAAVAAAIATGGSAAAGTWTVDLPGGRLRVILDGRTSFLSGPAVIVAEGELDRSWLAGTAVTSGQSSPAA